DVSRRHAADRARRPRTRFDNARHPVITVSAVRDHAAGADGKTPRARRQSAARRRHATDRWPPHRVCLPRLRLPAAGDRRAGLRRGTDGESMTVSVDIWLRGSDFATTEQIEGMTRGPAEWQDEDVRLLLEGMLRAMDRRKRPGEADRDISLRGLSW